MFKKIKRFFQKKVAVKPKSKIISSPNENRSYSPTPGAYGSIDDLIIRNNIIALYAQNQEPTDRPECQPLRSYHDSYHTTHSSNHDSYHSYDSGSSSSFD